MVDCALFEPDIPQNAGTILRLGACFGVPIHVIHPCGFALTDRRLRRAGMDYLDRAQLREHADWPAFAKWCAGAGRRLVALSRAGTRSLYAFQFAAGDVLLFGRESAGLPPHATAAAHSVLRIPIRSDTRSLNVALAAAIGVSEALRQVSATGGELPEPYAFR